MGPGGDTGGSIPLVPPIDDEDEFGAMHDWKSAHDFVMVCNIRNLNIILPVHVLVEDK